ncbi:MAG: amino acid ABC transporter permease [Desulfobacterales bacterium]|jgi:His/Glu/Gln/Arg/opine family amino acid ABC transporter permease subunit
MDRRIASLTGVTVLLWPLIFGGCSRTEYQWGWYEVLPTTLRGTDNLMFLLGGLRLTISLASVSIVISICLGLLVALPGLAANRLLRVFNRIYVETFRSVPTLVMILWVYYGLPVVFGVSLGPFTAGVLALALCDSAFEAEIFRGGIQSIERGQIEAADAIGLGYIHKMRLVILPQAIRRILPPLGNQFVYMLKMSSLVSVVGLQELTRKANELTVTVYRPLEIYTVLVLEYLLLILIVSRSVRWLETRLGSNAQFSGR